MGAVDLELDRSDELVLASAEAIRIAGLPGDQVVALDPDSPWQLVALLPLTAVAHAIAKHRVPRR